MVLLALAALAPAMHVAAQNGAAPGGAQNNAAPPGQPGSESDGSGTPEGFFQILKAGGAVGIGIMVLSVIGVALAVEHMLTIRAGVLMPAGLAEQVRELLKTGHLAQAMQQCKLQPSFLSHVLQSGISEIDGKWAAVEKAMEDAVAEQSARLYRKIEYLSLIGNIAPMLGLLGTVIGMIFAFREVAATQGAARAADLAEGIYLALVTTVEGLIVAIPALAAFAIFRNRVDQLVAEVTYQATHVFTPFKRSRRAAPMAERKT